MILTNKNTGNNNIKEVFENGTVYFKSDLVQMNSASNLLDFDKQLLSFPLHKGARGYFNRNEPLVWSKYVKMI